LQRIALRSGYWMDIIFEKDDQYLVRLTAA
jgi:hypothetical protein